MKMKQSRLVECRSLLWALLLAVQWLLLVGAGVGVGDVAPPPPGLVKKLVHYYLHFGLGDVESEVCYEWNRDNETHNSFVQRVDRCAASKYMPGILTAKQIGWKKSSQPPPKKKKLTSSLMLNATNKSLVNTSAETVEPVKTSYEVVGNSTEIVHAYLAFALVLPGHPFSTNMVAYLRKIGPMYPNVNVVIGDGNEFKEMYAQYGVRSFPRLFLFTKGCIMMIVVIAANPIVICAHFKFRSPHITISQRSRFI
jgi:hypothetical protein